MIIFGFNFQCLIIIIYVTNLSGVYSCLQRINIRLNLSKMFRQKSSLNKHFYRSVKSINFSVRNLHLTYCVLLRRVASVRKSSPESRNQTEVQSVAGEFHVTQNSKINNNFYGIESDEGVIHIENTSKNPMRKTPHAFLKQFSSSIKSEENVKSLRFGNIRWDDENKPKFHGQYKNISKEIDHVTQNGDTVDKNSSLSSVKNFSTTLHNSSFNPKQFVSNNQETSMKNYVTHPIHENNMHIPQNIVNVKNEESTNFIDELYFPNQTTKDMNNDFPSNTTYSDNGDNTSFIDELYFSNQETENKYISDSEIPGVLDQGMTLDSRNIKNKYHNASVVNESSEISESDYQQKIENNVSAKVVDKNSFIEDLNFPTEVAKNSDDNKITESSANHLKHENFSFIDESYLGDKLNKDLHNIKFVKEKQNSSSDLSPDKYDNIKISYINSDENGKKNIFKFNVNSFATDQFHQPETIKELTLDMDLAKNNLHVIDDSCLLKPNYNQLNTTEEVRQQKHNLSNQKASRKDSTQVNMKSNKLTQEQHKSKESILENPHLSDLRNKTQVKSDEENQADEFKTAFDFVNKLRNKRTQVQPKIKGGKFLPGREKLDSKGFRILENQVPNLQYFTREEILTMLKNNVLYSDNDVLVLNKPYNLVIHESKTTQDVCLSQYLDELATELDTKQRNPKLITVHRLDKETCGCLLLARNEAAADRLKSLFAQRKISKTYWVVTITVPDPLEGVIDIPIAEGTIDKKSRMVLQPKIPEGVPYVSHAKNGKRAVTRYKVIATSGNAALVEVKPETGIKHQIRVHLGFGLTCPILGDHKYSNLTKLAPQKLPSDLLQRLHVRQSKVRYIPMHIYARSILIPHYNEERNLFVMAPMPIHMSLNLQKLKFKKKS